jgi:hypothetical protein
MFAVIPQYGGGMKTQAFLSVIVFVSSITAISQTEIQQPSFGIYLTQLSGTVIQTLERSPIPVETVPLEPTPLISEKDIVQYDFESHTIKLTPDCFRRVSYIHVGDVSYGVPFVVVANGRKAYMGMFWSMASSIPTSYPHILDAERFFQKDGCSTCIQIRPPKRDVRVTTYMALKTLGLLKKGQ